MALEEARAGTGTSRGRPSPPSSRRAPGAAADVPAWVGPALLACALAFNAILLAPELRLGQPAWNDTTFHVAAAERLEGSLAGGEAFLDPWTSEWALGYPVWRTYQPLPHLVAAAVFRLTESFASHLRAFAALQYLLLVTLPLSVYTGARWLGLGPVGCGIASLLVFAPVGSGDFGRYGLGYVAFVRNGSGLYTQLVALHFLVLALGAVARALDTGRMRVRASLLLAATALSHIVFGYVVFVSAAVWAIVGPPGARARRLVRLLTVAGPALLLLAWLVVPMLLTAGEVNHSRWELAYKWDSFGAATILDALCSGNLLDAGRLPVLTLLVGIGTLLAARACAMASSRQARERSHGSNPPVVSGGFAPPEPGLNIIIDPRAAALPHRLLALALLWLLLFFGRATWGHLLVLVAVPGDFHLHRLQAAFELAAILLAAWGIDDGLRAAAAYSRGVFVAAATGAGIALVLLGADRAAYLQRNAGDAAASLRAYEQERPDLERALAMVRTILAERPGRVAAGKRPTWGDRFRLGDLPVYVFVTLAHMDQVSFLYHSMSLTADVMQLRNETDYLHDVAFGVRAVVAPADLAAPPHWRERGRYGRFVVYECSPEGYFGLVDIGAQYSGPRATWSEPNAAWLQGPWAGDAVVVALGRAPDDVPRVARWHSFPSVPAAMLAPRGHIVREWKEGETYHASIVTHRPCYALVKITYYPGLVATVDGRESPLVRVTPGFAAVPLAAGTHDVDVRYAPGPLKPALFVAGLLLFVAVVVLQRLPAAAAMEAALAAQLTRLEHVVTGPRATTAAVLLALMLVALHPLFRGQLVEGHDATAYPPRQVEFDRAVRDGQLPPVWAPDLGNGYGQPLFEFAPPLLYLAAAPLRAIGCGLADALQLGLAALCMAGAAAVYGLGRRMGSARSAALGGAAAWLFGPYITLDLYVRAAFAEAAAAAMAPVALLGVVAALDQPSAVRVALGAMAVALVPLAHNAVALLVLPALVLVVVARRSWRACGIGALVLALGLGLATFFWLPALIEKAYVKSELLREGYLHWDVHAISAWQLLWSPWGYGVSVPGPNDGMSFALGPVHLLLAVGGLAAVWRCGTAQRRWTAAACAVAAAAGAWLATDWSAVVWSHVATLRYLTHPWRTLVLPATFLPLLAVYAFDWLTPPARVWAIAAVVGINVAHTLPKGFVTFDEEYYTPTSIAEKGLHTTTYEEYEPRWVRARPPYTAQRLGGQPPLAAVQPLVVRSAHQEFTASSLGATVGEAATFYYPGWRVLVDGRDTPVLPVPDRGTMAFYLSPGSHHVVLDLEPTPLRRAATLVSVVTAGVLLLSVVGARRRGRPRPPG
jgi:hypothetical protein